MKRAVMISVTIVLIAAACGADSTESTRAAEPPTDAAATPTVASASSVGSSSSGSSEATTAADRPVTTSRGSSTSTSAPIAFLPVLADGRPATFLAVTDDYEAVELDTATGEVLRSFGQLADAAALAAEPMLNVVDSIWRTVDGKTVIVSECCEPAGGSIHYLRDGATVSPETRAELPSSDGWYVAPSPVSNEFVRTGYFLTVGTGDEVRFIADADAEYQSYPLGLPTWSSDGREISWIGENFDAGPPSLFTLELESGSVQRVELSWQQDQYQLRGLARQQSGNFVVFIHDRDAEATTGAILSPEGELTTTFPVEADSVLGGYERTGTFLIYVDGDGIVRWQGRGRSGELAEGYVFASW